MNIRSAFSMAARPVLMAGLLALAASPPLSVLAQDSSVLTYHGDNSRSGQYVVPTLSWEKARSVELDRAFNAHVAGSMYAQPLYWRPPGADAGMLFVATEDDVVQALDATTGKELWRRVVGRPVRRSSLPCGNIDPLGITGTPAIDPTTQAIYFDGAVERRNGPRHEVFALSTKDGSVLPGWPIDVAALLQKAGRHFDPSVHNQRAALTLLDGTVYVAFSGHFGDCGNYHGWVVGLSCANPASMSVSKRVGEEAASGRRVVSASPSTTSTLRPGIRSAHRPGATVKPCFTLDPTCAAVTTRRTILRRRTGKHSMPAMRISGAAIRLLSTYPEPAGAAL